MTADSGDDGDDDGDDDDNDDDDVDCDDGDGDDADEQRVRGQHLHDGDPQDGVLAPAAGGGEYSTVLYSTVQYSTVAILATNTSLSILYKVASIIYTAPYSIYPLGVVMLLGNIDRRFS